MRRANALTAVIVGLLAFVLLAATGHHLGLTYDEPIYMSKSLLAYQWLVDLLSGREATSEAAVRRYWDATRDQQPGSIKLLFGTVTGLLGGVLPVPVLTAGRLGTMLLAAVLVGVLYWLVTDLWGNAAGVVAAGGLLLMPRVWTHMHLAALDAPIMALSFFTVVLVFLAARHDSPWLCVAAGVVFGLALGTKLNSFFIPLIVLPWLLCLRKWRLAAWTAGAMVVVGLLTLWATWPWLWHDTWARAAEYFEFHLHHYHVATTYFGTTWELAPWHYAVVMTAITTPPIILVLGALGLYAAALGWKPMMSHRRAARPSMPSPPTPLPRGEGCPQGGVRGRTKQTGATTDNAAYWQGACLILLGWGLVVNIAPSMLPWAPKYGGVRLFLPMFPYVAAISGVGFYWLSSVIIERGRDSWGAGLANFPAKLRATLVVLVIFALVVAVGNCHPFGMSYYNSLIGGPSGAYRLGMEPTYWGDTYLAAVAWLNREAEDGAKVWINVVGFASSVELYKPFGMLREDLRITAGDAALTQADYVVVQHKQNEMTPLMHHLAAAGRPLFAEQLDGVALVWVFAGDDPACWGARHAPAAVGGIASGGQYDD